MIKSIIHMRKRYIFIILTKYSIIFTLFVLRNKRDCCNGFNTIAALKMENGLECGTAFWDLALALANGFSIYHTFF